MVCVRAVRLVCEELFGGEADFAGSCAVGWEGGGDAGEGFAGLVLEGVGDLFGSGGAEAGDGGEGLLEAVGGGEGFELVEGEAVGAAEGEFGHGRVGPVFEEPVGQVGELLVGEAGEGVGGPVVLLVFTMGRGGLLWLGVGLDGFWCCDHAGIVADGRGGARGKGWMTGKQRTDRAIRSTHKTQETRVATDLSDTLHGVTKEHPLVLPTHMP